MTILSFEGTNLFVTLITAHTKIPWEGESPSRGVTCAISFIESILHLSYGKPMTNYRLPCDQ